MLKRASLLILGIFFCFSAYSNSIKITPTRIDLSAREKMATLTVSNPSENSILIQTALLHWSQENGNDVYRPTEQLIVLPPAFSIAPGQKQQIRIALQHPPSNEERAYRLYLREIVSNNAPVHPPGLKIALRIGIPIFVAPLSQSVELLDWGVSQRGNKMLIRLKNKGNAHVLIEELELLSDNGNTIVSQQNVFKYLLPSQSFQWSIPFRANQHYTNYQVRARVNGANIECIPLKEKVTTHPRLRAALYARHPEGNALDTAHKAR